MVEEIVTTSWEILESNEQEKKEKRLETAGWKSLTARVSNWKLEDDAKDKHQSDKKRRKEWQHTDSPSKKARCGKGVMQGSTTTSPDLLAEKKGPVQSIIKAIEAKTDSGGPKKPQNNKKLQVKSKKWVRKRNGLFGWVSCIQAEKGGTQAPQSSLGTLYSRGNNLKNGNGGKGGTAGDNIRIMDVYRKGK